MFKINCRFFSAIFKPAAYACENSLLAFAKQTTLNQLKNGTSYGYSLDFAGNFFSISRKSFRKILPDADFGMLSTMSMHCGAINL